MGFCDGHVQTMKMVVVDNSTGPGYYPLGLPSNPANLYDWCYSPNALGDWTEALGGDTISQDYPLNGGTTTSNPDQETCGEAVKDLYSHSTLVP